MPHMCVLTHTHADCANKFKDIAEKIQQEAGLLLSFLHNVTILNLQAGQETKVLSGYNHPISRYPIEN